MYPHGTTIHVDVPLMWQHMWICTQQWLRAGILTQQSDGLMDQQRSEVHTPTSPPANPCIPMVMRHRRGSMHGYAYSEDLEPGVRHSGAMVMR
jgi:hypothetical protein